MNKWIDNFIKQIETQINHLKFETDIGNFNYLRKGVHA